MHIVHFSSRPKPCDAKYLAEWSEVKFADEVMTEHMQDMWDKEIHVAWPDAAELKELGIWQTEGRVWTLSVPADQPSDTDEDTIDADLTPGGSGVRVRWLPSFGRSVLGCVEADLCN